MKRGVLLFAFDNEVIDYGGLAKMCAGLIGKHLQVPVILVTDTQTKDRLQDASCFHSIIEVEPIRNPQNIRRYAGYDTDNGVKDGMFLNHSRADADLLSPFDETLIIDVDYLVQSPSLDQCWGSPHPFMMDRKITRIQEPLVVYEKRLNDVTIPLYWATVFWFRKHPMTTRFFEVVRRVREQYFYYSRLYRFMTGVYRNDYAFSIAAHILGGYGIDGAAPSLPVDTLLWAWDDAELIDAIPDGLIFKAANRGETYPLLVQGSDVHCIHKKSLVDVHHKIIEVNALHVD